jgi:hypothetical protein
MIVTVGIEKGKDLALLGQGLGMAIFRSANRRYSAALTQPIQ